jgi:RNA polymerase sigma factor (sigma-70 family)
MDLFNSGVLGLQKAISRFDPRFSVRFATYAFYWIRAFVYEARNNKRVVRHHNNANLESVSAIDESRPSVAQLNQLPPTPDLNADSRAIYEKLLNIIEDNTDKQVFTMYFYEGLTFKETGKILNLTRRQVIYRMGKVKRAIVNGIDGAYLEGILRGAI